MRVHAGAFILGAVTTEKGRRNFKLVGQEERKGRGGNSEEWWTRTAGAHDDEAHGGREAGRIFGGHRKDIRGAEATMLWGNMLTALVVSWHGCEKQFGAAGEGGDARLPLAGTCFH